jgi:hypothetical protein
MGKETFYFVSLLCPCVGGIVEAKEDEVSL